MVAYKNPPCWGHSINMWFTTVLNYILWRKAVSAENIRLWSCKAAVSCLRSWSQYSAPWFKHRSVSPPKWGYSIQSISVAFIMRKVKTGPHHTHVAYKAINGLPENYSILSPFDYIYIFLYFLMKKNINIKYNEVIIF